MNLETIREGSGTVLRIAGELDARDKARVTKVLDDLLGRGETRFVFDMERLTYMGSTGIGCLLRTRKAALEKGGGVALVRPSPFIRRVLGTVGIEGEFPTFDNAREALRAVGAIRSAEEE